MKLSYNNARGVEESKCLLTVSASVAECKLEGSSKTPKGQPTLSVPTFSKQEETIESANAICRYIAASQSALQHDDLAVHEWIDWEAHTLQAWFRKASKKEAGKQELIDLLSTVNPKGTTEVDFLVGGQLSLADIIVTLSLHEAFQIVQKEDTSSPILERFQTYVSNQMASDLFSKVKGTKKSAAPAKALDTDVMQGKTYDGVLYVVESLFSAAVQSVYPDMDIPPGSISRTNTKNAKLGDYQCNCAMAIFNKLKGTPDAEKGPRDVAQKIIDAVPSNPVLDRLSIAGPGFINAFLTPQFLAGRLEKILTNGVKSSPQAQQKIVVDFSSPNIAKDMHVGHLRSTIIGDTICRVLEFQGHDVKRVNHVGDWGTQFGMLICHLTESYPDWETKMPDVQDLTKLYQDAKKRFDEDAAFQQRSKDQVVKLQSGDEISHKVWTTICELSRNEYQKVYDRLDVKLEECGESFYNSIIPDVLNKVRAKGLMEDSDGAEVVFTKSFKQPFLLVKRDGSYLYATTDMAAIWYRLHQLHADRVIYYTDYTQKDHFQLLFEVARMADILDPKVHRVDHVGFGTVNDESGKRFKTRSGDTVRLVDLLDEAKSRMKAQLEERIANGQTTLPSDQVESAAEKLGYGAVKYFDLRQSPTSNYVFSFDRMLSTNGDTAVYLMFAYARLSSILRKSGIDMDELRKQSGSELKPAHASELALAVELLQLQDVISFINKDLASNRLCAYLYTVADKVQTFVTACRVLKSEEEKSRLLLCDATLRVMETCFSLLGIEPLDQI